MMSEMPPTPFDLKPVFVDGIKVEARPIEWNEAAADGVGNNAEGNPTVPTKYMTTCPECSQVIVFATSSLFKGKDGSTDNIACGECQAGVEAAEDQGAVEAVMATTASPFVDPIENKLLNIDNVDLTTIQPFKVSE